MAGEATKLAALQERYPSAKYEPAPDCHRCAGSGERQINGAIYPCPCLFLAPDHREQSLAILGKVASAALAELRAGESHGRRS